MKFLKNWEFNKEIIIIIVILIIDFVKNLKFNFYIFFIYIILYFILFSKINYFYQHSLFLHSLKYIAIKNIISFIIIILINDYINIIKRKFKFKNLIKNDILLNIIINNNIINFYIMINKNLYKIFNKFNIIFYIIYWININNKKNLMKILFYNFLISLYWIYIFFKNNEIYNIYNICGKNYNNINIIFEQQISSIIFWVINPILFFTNNIILNFIKTN